MHRIEGQRMRGLMGECMHVERAVRRRMKKREVWIMKRDRETELRMLRRTEKQSGHAYRLA